MPSQPPNPPEPFPDFGPRHSFHDAACQTQSPHSSSLSLSSGQAADLQTQTSHSDSCLITACRVRLPSSNSSFPSSYYQESINSSTDQEDFENGLRSRSMTSLYNFLCQPSVEESLRRQELTFEDTLQKHHSSQSSSPLQSSQTGPHISRPISFASSQSSMIYGYSREDENTINSATSHLAPRSNSRSGRNSVLAITPAEHPPLPKTEIARGFFENEQENSSTSSRQSSRGVLDGWIEPTCDQLESFYRSTSSSTDSVGIQSRDVTDIEETYLESPSSENTGFTRAEGSRGNLINISHAEDPRLQLQPQIQRKEEQNLSPIQFTGPDDPGQPMNWKLSKKCAQTFLLTILTFIVTFTSSVFSPADAPVAREFKVGSEIPVSGVSLFVLGFFIGPSIWGPTSEIYGRKTPLLLGFFIFTIFQIPVAIAQDLQTILVCRFFGGAFGAAPLAIVGGALADIWDPVNRGVAVCFFSGAIFFGPVIGPIVGGFVTKSHLSWRWTAWITGIIAFFFLITGLFCISESYTPLILQRRAKRLRYEKRQWGTHSKLDEKEYTAKEIANNYLLRPTKMLFYEPILSIITIYVGFIYGILYLFFEAYPIAFEERRGYNEGIGSLPFLGIAVGISTGCAIIIYTTKTRSKKTLETGKVIPEERLPPMIIGAVALPIGMFWFAWTSSPHITWVPQVIAGIPIGAGIIIIFLQSLNYIVDVYTKHTNSALAANTMIRSLFGAGFPIFARAMFHHLGINWACTTLGIIATASIPVPILLLRYGKDIRRWSRYVNMDEDDPETFEVPEISRV